MMGLGAISFDKAFSTNDHMITPQEIGNNLNGGRIPRTADCHLINDLCDSVTPGDVLSVTAVVKVSMDTDGGARSANKFTIYLQVCCNSIYF
jgi:DNA replicative helicase MCM subunit Mcm2 (Cdc46/Mcm family)